MIAPLYHTCPAYRYSRIRDTFAHVPDWIGRMRELVRAADASHEASIRFALATAGIHAEANSPSYLASGRDRNSCVFLVDEADYERASALVADIQQSSLFNGPERQRVKYLPWALAGLIVALVVYALWRGPS